MYSKEDLNISLSTTHLGHLKNGSATLFESVLYSGTHPENYQKTSLMKEC